MTARMPDVVALVADLPSDQMVLDGEGLALNVDGRPELFQVVASRAMSSADVGRPQALPPRRSSSTCFGSMTMTCSTNRSPAGSK